jgi:serine/threonine protein kinase
LYEVVGILHRDLSPNNIMYRIINGKVHGVLTDFDLSSWKSSLTSDYTQEPRSKGPEPLHIWLTGCSNGTDALHLYRHDVESLFYIMLILATHYEGVGG